MLEATNLLGEEFTDSSEIMVATDTRIYQRSDVGAVLITTVGQTAVQADALAKTIGRKLPSTYGKIESFMGYPAIWLTPCSWIILCAQGSEGELLDSVSRDFPDRTAHASLHSDALGWITLEGKMAESLLRQGSFLTLESSGIPVGSAKRTPVAGIPAIIIREKARLV